MTANIYIFPSTIYRLVQPLCLGGLVAYFVPNQTQISSDDAYMYASGIVLTTAFMIVTFHPFILYILKTACKLRLGCGGLIYRKSLRLSKSTTEDGLNGRVINLLSNDLGKFDIGLAFLHDIWKGPIESLVFGIIIYMEIGISAVVGMAFLASFIPLQGRFKISNRLLSEKSRLIFRVFIKIDSLDWKKIRPVTCARR